MFKMLGTRLKEFEEFNIGHESKFESVMILAKKARKLANSTHYSVRDSQALTWALTGQKPVFVDKDEYKELRKMNRTEDILNYVSDPKIVDSVNKSLAESRENKKLTYIYNDSLSEEDKQRVSILTNLIWYRASIN